MNIKQRRMIGAVKAGQTALGWDDVTYRSVLARLTGKSSSTLCTLTELEQVKEYMHQQGYPRKAKKHGRKPSVPASKKPYSARLRRCWLMLSARGNMLRLWHSICLVYDMLTGWIYSN